jgi:hypothetical protein
VQLVINEIDSSAATSLHAVKLLALYLTGDKVSALDLTYIAPDLLLIVLCSSGSGSSSWGSLYIVGFSPPCTHGKRVTKWC